MTAHTYGHTATPFAGGPDVSFHLLRARGRQIIGYQPTSHTIMHLYRDMNTNVYGHATTSFAGSHEVSFHCLRALGRQLLEHQPMSHAPPVFFFQRNIWIHKLTDLLSSVISQKIYLTLRS